MRRAFLPWLALAVLAGCQRNIGDSCGNSTDCSPTGDRQCDRAQPGGYCTVFSCDPDTCPQGVCVEWRFNPSRTAETWCMKTCRDDGNCRSEYSCVLPGEINVNGAFEPGLPEDQRVARIIDLQEGKAESKICVALTPLANVGATSGLDGGL